MRTFWGDGNCYNLIEVWLHEMTIIETLSTLFLRSEHFTICKLLLNEEK